MQLFECLETQANHQQIINCKYESFHFLIKEYRLDYRMGNLC